MAQNTLIYPSHYELMEELSDEQAGILIKTIGRYQRGEAISIDDVLVKGVWMGLKPDFDKQKETYESVVKRNRENGKKGGRPKTQDNPKNPSGFSLTQNNPKNLKDKDKDKDKYKVNSSNSSIDTSEYKVDNFKQTPVYKDRESVKVMRKFDELFKDI